MNPGTYVLATKYRDGNSNDPWYVGFFVRKEDNRFIVADENGKITRDTGFGRCVAISEDEGKYLLENVEKLRDDYIYLSVYGFLRYYRKIKKKNKNNNPPITLTDIHGEQTTIDYPDYVSIGIDFEENSSILSIRTDNEIKVVYKASIDSLHELINLYETAIE
jgi:hypothetical protein